METPATSTQNYVSAPAVRKGHYYFSRIPMTQKIFFLDHLRVMMGAGLSVVEALRILKKEIEHKELREMVEDVTHDVEQGQDLSAALEKHPRAFDSMYIKMIAAGEVAGRLEESLTQMVSQMKRSHEIAANIKSAMMYPLVVISAMGLIGIMMAVFVLPKLVSLFKDFGSTLPLPTRILIKISDILGNPIYLVLILGSLAGMVALHIWAMKTYPLYKQRIHSFLLQLPIAGFVLKQINLARFSLTLSSLLRSTIPIIDATRITAETCGNVLYQNALIAAAHDMKEGKPLSDILHQHPKLFPPMVTEMILVGEKTGEVEQLLAELSDFYSSEVDHTMKNFTTIIEPVIIILLGIAVAGVALAIIMPMYSLVEQF